MIELDPISREAVARLRGYWTCSDYVRHEHCWRWTAWLCGRVQLLWAAITNGPR